MDFKTPIEALVHLWEDGAFSRRDLVRRVARHTGSLASAAAAVAALGVPEAVAQQACPDNIHVAEDSPDIVAQDVQIQGEVSQLFTYVVRPANADGPQPGVMVIHENRGLVEHIRDVTRRVARAGFVGLAVDLLSRAGGVQAFPDPADQTQAYNRLTADGMLKDLLAGLDYLKNLDGVRGDRLGVVGFCAGGGNVWNLAVNSPDIKAAVPFYGPTPTPPDVVETLAGPVLGIYAELDRALTTRMLALVPTLYDKQKSFGLHVYPGTNHAFHNDTGPRYDPAAACDAWAKAIDFFNRTLRAG